MVEPMVGLLEMLNLSSVGIEECDEVVQDLMSLIEVIINN